jgi:hypothetical protein
VAIQERMARLARFEEWGAIHPIPFEELISKTAWDEYWAQLEVILDAMQVAQEKAVIIRKGIMSAIAELRAARN